MPAVGDHLTAKYYVDEVTFYSVNESSLFRLDLDKKLGLDDEQSSKVLNSILTSPKFMLEIPTKTYVDSSHENSRSRRDLSSVFKDQDKEFDKNKLTNLSSVSVNRNQSSDNELGNKKLLMYQ